MTLRLFLDAKDYKYYDIDEMHQLRIEVDKTGRTGIFHRYSGFGYHPLDSVEVPEDIMMYYETWDFKSKGRMKCLICNQTEYGITNMLDHSKTFHPFVKSATKNV